MGERKFRSDVIQKRALKQNGLKRDVKHGVRDFVMSNKKDVNFKVFLSVRIRLYIISTYICMYIYIYNTTQP